MSKAHWRGWWSDWNRPSSPLWTSSDDFENDSEFFEEKIVKVLSGNAQNRNPGLDNKNVNRDHPSRFDSKLPYKHESSYPNTDNHPMYAWRYLAIGTQKPPTLCCEIFCTPSHCCWPRSCDGFDRMSQQKIPFEFSHRTVLYIWHMISGNLKHGFANHEAFSSSLQAQRLQAKHHKRDVCRTCKLFEKSATPKQNWKIELLSLNSLVEHVHWRILKKPTGRLANATVHCSLSHRPTQCLYLYSIHSILV